MNVTHRLVTTYDVIFRLTNLLTTFGLKWRIYYYYWNRNKGFRFRMELGTKFFVPDNSVPYQVLPVTNYYKTVQF